MARVTDRLSKENIIELAKQEYDTSKKSTLPSEIIKLASNGKIYPKDHPLSSGTIELRYMTAYDEDILTNTSYVQQGVMLDKLLDSIIVTPGITADDIANVDKDGLIIQARILAYGSDYPVEVTDPKTGNRLSRTVDLKTLNYLPFNLESDDNGEFTYNINDKTTIKFAFLKTNIDNDITISKFLSKLIKQVDDNRDSKYIEEFIRYTFLAKDAKKFRTYVTDNAPGLVLETTFTGDDGSTFTAGFQVGSDLFWF
jgi:hypothetical protein